MLLIELGTSRDSFPQGKKTGIETHVNRLDASFPLECVSRDDYDYMTNGGPGKDRTVLPGGHSNRCFHPLQSTDDGRLRAKRPWMNCWTHSTGISLLAEDFSARLSQYLALGQNSWTVRYPKIVGWKMFINVYSPEYGNNMQKWVLTPSQLSQWDLRLHVIYGISISS